jgi:hypothetical protein
MATTTPLPIAWNTRLKLRDFHPSLEIRPSADQANSASAGPHRELPCSGPFCSRGLIKSRMKAKMRRTWIGEVPGLDEPLSGGDVTEVRQKMMFHEQPLQSHLFTQNNYFSLSAVFLHSAW